MQEQTTTPDLLVQTAHYVKFNRAKFYKKHKITLCENTNAPTLEEAKAELQKIKDIKNGTGFAYFFLEYCTVSHPTTGKVVIKDSAYKWQVNAALEFIKNRYIISLKSRQVAFSTTVGAYALYRALFFDSQRIVIISKNQRDSTTLLERIKFMYEHLPPWLKQETSEFAKTYVTFKHNSSKITSLPNGGDPAQGESLSLLVLDEFASYEDSQSVLSAATPALSAGSLTPFTNDTLPSQLFIVSTLPRKDVVDNDYLRILHTAQDNPDSRYKLIDVEVDDISYYRDKNWHQEMFETLGSRGYKIEVLKKEVYETENCLISGEVLAAIEAQNPIRTDFINPDMVDEEGFCKDLNLFSKMRDNWDSESGYLKGLWIWEDPIPNTQYVMTCLPTGEKVLTTNGLKNIEDVELNDTLYSKDGAKTKIINTQITKVKNKDIYDIGLDSIYRRTKFTGEHPIYASKSIIERHGKTKGKSNPRYWEHDFKFYPAKEIQKGDWLLYPNVYYGKPITENEIVEMFSNSKSKRYDFDMPDDFILNEEVWWYIGLWIAEGWTNKKKSISTAHNLIKEYYLIEKITKLFSKYGRSTSFREVYKTNSLIIHTSNVHLCNFLNDNFGKYAKNKNLPEWVKFLPDKYKIQLVKGYLLGDGCIINKKENKRKMLRTNFVSISLKLLEDFQDVLFSLGVTSSLNLLRNEKKTLIQGRMCNQQKAYSLNVEIHESFKLLNLLNIEYDYPTPKHRKQISNCHMSDDNKHIYIRVKDNIIHENYNGYVYNFETEDHTFLCNYISTHNCDVAGGEAKDYCAFHVLKITDEVVQVAEYKGKVNTEDYKEVLLRVAEYYNNAKLSVERNGLGINICQYFGDTINYENFYWHQKSKHQFQAGFPMVQPIRGNSISYLENYITKGTIKINSMRLINELRNFGITARGKIAAISGNDDLVMALCQFCYLSVIGWAVSDEEFMIDSIDKKEDSTPVSGKTKYWDELFDADEDEEEQVRELKNILKSTGQTVDMELFK